MSRILSAVPRNRVAGIKRTAACALRSSIAAVVIGGTSAAGGKANIPGIWGASLFLVLLLTMLNTFGVSAGVRLLLTGLIIVGVITAAGGEKVLR
jgi:ribose transport system permease protein